MRPYEAYWLHKQASGVDWENARQQARTHLHDAHEYWQKNKPAMLRSTANNLMFGLLTSPRGAGPVSLVGSSTGGVIDGMLFRPLTDGAIHLVGTGLRKFYGLGEK